MNNEPINLAEYVIIPRSEIPAARSESGYVMAGDYEAALCDELNVSLAWRQARECIAVALFLENIEAAKDKRRDELALESYGLHYSVTPNNAQFLINRIIELESK